MFLLRTNSKNLDGNNLIFGVQFVLRTFFYVKQKISVLVSKDFDIISW